MPGFEPAKPTDRLFLAIFPDAQHAARLAALAAQHLADHRLGSGATETSRLHVTVFDLGDYTELPPGLVANATEALSRLMAKPFTIHFDQIGSFSRQSIGPLVLTASNGNEELHALRKQLATHLRASTLGRLTHGSFTPHMTVAYKAITIPFRKITPIAWPAGEVVLIHSLLGQTRHIRLAGKQLG
ncbi:2'-5' RNA ligase [Dyella lipolytica]|nr:2'-5' RNA ligase [Dyella lipolytica]